MTGITKPYSCCYANSADMQLVTKIIFDQKLLIFLKHLFHTGIYGGTCHHTGAKWGFGVGTYRY
jgi:hypothetical protein